MPTFAVSDVSKTGYTSKTVTQRNHLANILKQDKAVTIEACSGMNEQVLSYGKNALFRAVEESFNNHHALKLSPDAIWLTVAMGLARHINENAEKLRKKFVQFEGKQEIEVRRDHFILGSPENDWEGCFPEFSAKIKEYIGDANHKLFISDFTTTGVREKAASEIVLMDAMQSYFEYVCSTCCGIPQVELTGTVEDWEKVRDKVNNFDGLGLDFWLPQLKQALDYFVSAAKGSVDKKIWQSFYKYGGGSGGPYISGWLTWLLPYIKQASCRDDTISWNPNPMLKKDLGAGGSFDGLTSDVIPPSLSEVPFTWKYFAKELKYKFVGGLTGAKLDGGVVEPVFGWAVVPV